MGQTPSDDVSELAAVEREVDELRLRTQALLEELERRIRDGVDRARGTVERVKRAVDVPAHLRALPRVIKENPKTSAGIGAGVLALTGLAITLAILKRRRDARVWPRVRARAAAYRRILAEPHAVFERRPAHLGRRLLAAVLTTAATVIVRKMLTRAFERPAAMPGLPAHHAV
jgi:ElaB/YqjD/DUF883 family membrane-anchored ribosome-binding protein